MKKNLPKDFLFQICMLLMIVWCAVILLLGHVFRLGIGGVFSYFYVPVCIVAVYIQAKKYKPPKNDSGTVGIYFYYSFVFLILAIIINAIYVFIGNRKLSLYIIAVDIILFAAYFAIVLSGAVYKNSLPNKIQRVQEITAFPASVSRKVGIMISGASDPEIHSALVELKRSVDYSSDTGGIDFDEVVFCSELDKLNKMIDERGDKGEILKEISTVDSMWKARNAIL